MARTTLTDVMQTHAFWLFDVAPIDPLALPIFTPLIGFSAITTPEVTITPYDVNEANWYYTKQVLQRADTSAITLSRASRWIDADFYKWTMAALTGDTGGNPLSSASSAVPRPLSGTPTGAIRLGGITPRRNLLLIHFLAHSPLPPAATAAAAALGLLSSAPAGLSGAIQGALGVASVTGNLGPFQFAPRLPGKAWMLYGCVPTRYKAGGDFDANSAEVSIQEMDVSVEYFDEISLSSI